MIKKFAAQFDPQRFHLDEEEGRKSLFGGLAASGWHVGSVCMKLLVANGQRQMQEAVARGEKVAVWGPSPGFRDLRWLKPVLAGDTISLRHRGRLEAGFRKAPRMGHRAKPATPAPTSAANWRSRCWRRRSCRGGASHTHYRHPEEPRSCAASRRMAAGTRLWPSFRLAEDGEHLRMTAVEVAHVAERIFR